MIKKYLPNEIEIDFFPQDQKKYINNNSKENKIFEDDVSEETQFT